MTGPDGETQDLFKWECKIPGKKGVSHNLIKLIFTLESVGRRCIHFDDGVY